MDGFEAGDLIEVDGKKFFNIISNPMLVDSDGIDDPDEIALGINPLNSDTDFDSIPDNVDPEPLIPQTATPEFGALEIGRAIILGAVFGEAGIERNSMNWLVGGIASSPYYLVGWISFSLVPMAGAAADARDAVQAFINGDELGVALNAASVLSGLGDAAKVNGAVGLFVIKYPSKAIDVGKVLAKYVLKYVPFESVKLKALDAIYGGIVSALKKGDITADDLLKIVENNGDLGKTLGVVKRSDGIIGWLEEGLTTAEAKLLGKRPSGWKHILEEHEDDFIKYGVSGENEIRELIYRSIKEGSPQTIPIENGGGTVYIHYVTSDKPITTIVGSNGYIITSHPGLP